METGVIYLYTFPNGKVYVGQTRRNPKIRHREHLNPKIGPSNKGFWKAYIEQGEPKYQILEEYSRENVEALISILNERETYYIRHYKATDPEYGYNLKPAGTENLRPNKKIDKIRQYFFYEFLQSKWPEFKAMREKVGHENTMTEVEKELFQEYFVDKNIFANTKANNVLYDEMFDFAEFCFREDMQTMADEYVYENEGQLLKEFIDENSIIQLSLDGRVIDVFESQAAAAAAVGAKNAANINNAVLGKQKTAHGYRWVKAMDYQGDISTGELI
ncbi:MAG: hypothetical protein IKR83_04500 [Bacteroidales bacterium]|nr:hypothetical protein [Bacteroidales bacterium]